MAAVIVVIVVKVRVILWGRRKIQRKLFLAAVVLLRTPGRVCGRGLFSGVQGGGGKVVQQIEPPLQVIKVIHLLGRVCLGRGRHFWRLRLRLLPRFWDSGPEGRGQR